MKHYIKEELELYRHGQMSMLGRINCSIHLQKCRECQALLKDLEAEDSFVEELRQSVHCNEEVEKKGDAAVLPKTASGQ